MRALREDFATGLAKKTEEIERLNDMIREMRLIAELYNELQCTYHDLQSEKAAADSQVKELTADVGLVTADNEALTQQNSKMKQQNEVQDIQSIFGCCCSLECISPACVCTNVHTLLIVVCFVYC